MMDFASVPDSRRAALCLRVDAGGDGRRVEGKSAEGSRKFDLDAVMGVDRWNRVGRGRLLNVRLRGIPPIGSSGRQTYVLFLEAVGAGTGGRAVMSLSACWKKCEEEDDEARGCGALAVVLDSDRLLLDEAVVAESVVLLDRRRLKGLKVCKEAMELSRRSDVRGSVGASFEPFLRDGIVL